MKNSFQFKLITPLGTFLSANYERPDELTDIIGSFGETSFSFVDSDNQLTKLAADVAANSIVVFIQN